MAYFIILLTLEEEELIDQYNLIDQLRKKEDPLGVSRIS